MTECPNDAAATAAVMPRLTITRCVRESFVLRHSFVIGHWAFVICNLSAHAAGGGKLRLAAAPYLGEDEVKFIRLLPNGFGGFSQLWNGANDHPDKKLRFSRLLFAGSNLVLELLLRNRVIRFTVVGTHTRACSDDLRYQPLRHFVYRDALRKINDLLTKQSGALLQVIRLFIRRAHRSFGLRHSFVIGHPSFVIFNPRSTMSPCPPSGFELRHSFVIGHSSFVIRHFQPLGTMNQGPPSCFVIPSSLDIRHSSFSTPGHHESRSTLGLRHSFVIGHSSFVILPLHRTP